jgi:Tol biopolymer transport system component
LVGLEFHSGIEIKILTFSSFAVLLLGLFFLFPETIPLAQADHVPIGRIAFSSDRNGNEEIYTMNFDGTAVERLTNNSAYDNSPSWSKDGSIIAFVSNRDGNHEIYIMNADGSVQTRLTNNLGEDYGADWSPDGTQIVFNSNRTGNHEIYIMNADGSMQTNITNNVASDVDPIWSHDGTKIAFTSNRDGNNEVYIMNTDGTGQTRLTTDAAHDYQQSWLLDGTIIFASIRDGNQEVYKMNSDGTNQTRLTNSTGKDEWPRSSPDGTMIVFYTERDGNGEIYTMNLDGTDQIRLTNNGVFDGAPNWGTAHNMFTNIIELDAEQYEVNTGGIVTVTNNTANLNPGIIDTVLVQMTSTTDSTGFTVTLHETGTNVGIFESPEIIFSSAATNAGLRILNAPAGSTVFANYNPTDSALIVPAGGAFGIPDPLRFDSDLYVQESSGSVMVIDAAANISPLIQETIEVHVSSNSDTGFYVQLLEDDINSGTFTTPTAITFTLGSSQAPNYLHISNPSDTVTATYSSFDDATAIIVPPFSPPIATGIVDPAISIVCSLTIGAPNYDTDRDGLCDDMESQIDHPGLLAIEHPNVGFTYEYGGASCKPLIDDPSVVDGSPEDDAYGTLEETPACPDINTRDIYIEIDYMTNHKPDPSALVQVVRAFEAAPDPDGTGPIKPGIKLHLQVDEDIEFHQVSIPQSDVPPFDAANPHGGYYQIKEEKFRTEDERLGVFGDPQLVLDTKRQAFRYVLFGHNYNEATGSSGFAEVLGNDIMISLGEFQRGVGSPTQQAGTLFHEIGHSINLQHGGNVATPICKPNYISAMTYAFQFPTFVADRPLDFSRSAMTSLIEGSLKEAVGFDRTSPPGLTTVYGGVSSGVALSPLTTKTNDATMGIVLDGSNLYITDPGNHRVRKLTTSFGTPNITFGSSGTGNGQFKSPEGLAVNGTASSGFIFVADSGNNRIQIWQKVATSPYIPIWKKSTSGTLASPEGVAVNSTHIIVADTGNNHLVSYLHSSLATPAATVGVFGSGPGQFNSPWAVAFDGSGNLYVVDSGNHRIQKFNPDGVFVGEVGTRGSGPGQFISPRGIAISGGFVYVSDTGNHRIQKFTTGLVLAAAPSEFGTFGTGNGLFNSTEGVAVGGSPTSYIYVADTGNKRVQKFVTSSFAYSSKYPTTGTVFKVSVPVAVNFDRDNPTVIDTSPVSQPIHVLPTPGCDVSDDPGSNPITIFGVNDWAVIDLKFRNSNYFSNGQTQNLIALRELTAEDNNIILSSTIKILQDMIQALKPSDFSAPPTGIAFQDSLNVELNNAISFVRSEELASALAILEGTVQTDVNALPITMETDYKKVEILLALQNAINAIQLAIEPAAVSQIFLADDDAANTKEGVPVDISVLANDASDIGGDKSIDSFTQGSSGVVTLNVDNTLKYTPNAGQSGPDSFTYTISNLAGQTDSATVYVNITPDGGGCLIATAAFGSELAPQVQQLRELRDNTLLQTTSGSTFMVGFNQFYYTFSPTIADWERQNPVFKEAIKLAITPMITSFSLLNYVDIDSEGEILVYGISLILLNIGMYIVAPIGIGLFIVSRKQRFCNT